MEILQSLMNVRDIVSIKVWHRPVVSIHTQSSKIAAKLYLDYDFSNQLGSNQTFVGSNAVFSALNYELLIGTTTIRLYYDVSGSAGAVFAEQGGYYFTNAPAGSNSIFWDGTDRFGREVTSGLYVFVMRVGSDSFVRKATVIK